MPDAATVPVYRMVFGIADHQQAMLLEREVDAHPRFEIANVAANAILTVDLAEKIQPDVILLSDLSPGTPGRQVLADLARVAPNALVIITTGGDPRHLEDRVEVVKAIGEYDVDALKRALDATAVFLDTPDHGDRPERRSQAERRIQQDWTKVFSERRVQTRRASTS